MIFCFLVLSGVRATSLKIRTETEPEPVTFLPGYTGSREDHECSDKNPFFGRLNWPGSKCGTPMPHCFNATKPHCYTCQEISVPWNVLVNDSFDECRNKCYGFKLNDNLEKMFLCSLHLSYYSPRLNPDKNYIGFIFAGVKSADTWYYNNGNVNDNPNKKFRLLT